MRPGLHSDEFDIGVDTVARLIAEQFPELAALPIGEPVWGTVNTMFRLGPDLVARLPFTAGGADGIRREAELLPSLTDRLPTRIPRVIGRGEPDPAYPSPWLILEWIPGAPASPGVLDDARGLADDVIRFVTALRGLPTAGVPDGGRGRSLVTQDGWVRESLEKATDLVDVAALARIWDEALAEPDWIADAVWTHGDLLPSNVLVERGRLVGVLDFSGAGLCDPAGDLVAGWSLLDRAGRVRLRSELGVDDSTWNRGRGLALEQAIGAVPYYRDTFPSMAGIALHTLGQLLEE